METREQIRKKLDDLLENYIQDDNTDILLDILNGYNEENSYETIYTNDDDNIDMLFEGMKPSEIVDRFFFGSYEKSDAYIRFNGYANIESLHYCHIVDEIKCEKENIIDYLEKNIYEFRNRLDIEESEEE